MKSLTMRFTLCPCLANEFTIGTNMIISEGVSVPEAQELFCNANTATHD